MNTENNKKRKVINDLVKKKINNLKGVYGGVACTVSTKPILTQCYICTVTPPKDLNGGTTGQA